MAKTKDLTVKQRKFVKYFVESGNASEAALKAGYSFRESGQENLSKPLVLDAFQKLLDKNGLTDQKIIDKLNQLIDAKRVQSCNILIKKEDGKVIPQENPNDFIEVEDNHVQADMVKFLCKLKERLNGRDHKQDKPVQNFYMQFVNLVEGVNKEINREEILARVET